MVSHFAALLGFKAFYGCQSAAELLGTYFWRHLTSGSPCQICHRQLTACCPFFVYGCTALLSFAEGRLSNIATSMQQAETP